MHRWERRIGLALFAALILGWVISRQAGRGLEATLVLGDILAGPRDSILKHTTPPSVRESISYDVGRGLREGDLYLSDHEPARAGVVLLPGLTPYGRDDPRIVDFARTLARARLAVIVPDLENMRALQVTADDAMPISDAVTYLRTICAGRSVGIIGVSFAAGPAILSLFDDASVGGETRRHADYVVTIGGYYDLTQLITYITTGYIRAADGTWTPHPPRNYGRWIFLLSNAARIENPSDRALLSEMAHRKLQHADADIEDLAGALGPQGRSIYALLINQDPDHVPALVDAMPPNLVSELRRLDLSRLDYSGIETRFVLIHDSADKVIPPIQSEELAARLGSDRAETFLISSLDHANPKTPSLYDGWLMTSAIYAILSVRDAPASEDEPDHREECKN